MSEIKHNRPKYGLEFKQDAARLVLAERKPSGTESIVKKPGLSLADQAGLLRLRKKNEQLRIEREILKKATVFFAKEAE